MQPRLREFLGPRILDAYYHLPHTFIERRFIQRVTEAQHGEYVTLIAKSIRHDLGAHTKKRKVITVHDGLYTFDLCFFNMPKPYLEKVFPLGETKLISGKMDMSFGSCSITNPDFIGQPCFKDQWVGLEPVYPLTKGISQSMIKRVFSHIITAIPPVPEWIDDVTLMTHKWSSWDKAVTSYHQPDTKEVLNPHHPHHQRLAYDEFLAYQISVLQAAHIKKMSDKGLVIALKDDWLEEHQKKLPFQLTNGQVDIFQEFLVDLKSGQPMRRLLQGDVGSGKTILAYLTILAVVEKGYQAAILLPTEILAQQQYQTFLKLRGTSPYPCRLLTATTRQSEKTEIIEGLQQGSIPILLGTHAILEDNVQFKHLGLVVVDEQHRFGVEQRLNLLEKAVITPHMLVMSATPIPRTMQLAKYGGLSVSSLREKPQGRLPIQTAIMGLKSLDDFVQKLQHHLKEVGPETRVYWVCPLIEKSTSQQLTPAEERYRYLCKIFGNTKVGLVHGKMSGKDKESMMDLFKAGKIDILVATTVIEVGVDVPEATIMIVECAERFGLAQLHQLRGRVGRSDRPSSCVLLYSEHTTLSARKRLQIMKESQDGFYIAEQDLKMRGSGDLWGTLQSGICRFKVAQNDEGSDLYEELFEKAYRDAKDIIDQDPFLKSERGQALQILLGIFDRDKALRLVKSD